jgi:hypothetical protein
MPGISGNTRAGKSQEDPFQPMQVEHSLGFWSPDWKEGIYIV